MTSLPCTSRRAAALVLLLAPLTLVADLVAAPERGGQAGTVCPKPSDQCDHPEKAFAPHELPFRLPKNLKPNVKYRSAPFYAVEIARQRDPACDGGEYTRSVERLRRQAQTRFPDRKVFADHQCPDMSAVAYTTLGAPDNARTTVEAFVAVYAGQTEREAQTILSRAKARYFRATLRRMRVGYSRIVQ